MSPWLMKGLLVIAAVSSLSACGGDDKTNSLRAGDQFGSNDPDFFQPTTPTTPTPTPTPNASTAGIWFGSTTPDATPTIQAPMIALVTEEGDFVAIADSYLFVGQNTGIGASFDADPATYYGLDYRGVSSLMGTAVAGTSFEGSFAVGSGSSADSRGFQLDFSSLYTRSASLEKLAGVYYFDGQDGQRTMVADSSGNLTGEDYDGCTITGSVTVPHADRNYYRFTGTLGACGTYDGPMRALIFLDDDNVGGTDNVIVLLGETNSHGTGVIVTGAK